MRQFLARVVVLWLLLLASGQLCQAEDSVKKRVKDPNIDRITTGTYYITMDDGETITVTSTDAGNADWVVSYYENHPNGAGTAKDTPAEIPKQPTDKITCCPLTTIIIVVAIVILLLLIIFGLLKRKGSALP